MTKIEWTDATWNPIVGCSVTSPGCTNCYAMKMAGRLEGMASTNASLAHYVGTTQRSKAGFVWTGKVNMAPDSILTAPLRRRKSTRYFVNSMADLFHESVPDEWIDRVLAVMALAPQHIFQVLTKRSARMREYLSGCDWFCGPREPGRVASNAALLAKQLGLRNVRLEARWPLPNVWLGVSVEDQARADERIPDLLATPAAVRFISAEPLLGAVNIGQWIPTCYECGASCGLRLDSIPDVERCTECGEECDQATEPEFSEGCPKCNGELEPVCPDCGHYMVYQHPDTPNLDWVVAGGESGPGARGSCAEVEANMRLLLDQCRAAGVAFFGKQNFRKLPLPDDLLAQEFPA